MSATVVAKGLISWIPGVQRMFYDRSAGGGTGSAAYCYGVWMKHLTLLWAHGMQSVPRTVLELGPGASLGTGCAALLSGAERYLAIDAVAHLRPDVNLALFAELTELFRRRAPRPIAGFPSFDQYLDGNLFPSGILDEARLAAALEPDRLARIERAVRALCDGKPDEMLRYFTWDTLQPTADGEVDLLFSHVVLNHADDLDAMYAKCARWVRPGGWMSHQVDFTSLGTTRKWNGHWAFGEFAWKVIAGRRPYFVCREPMGTHLRLLDRHGFDVVQVMRGQAMDGIPRAELAPRWRGMSDEDLSTRSGFLVARRRAA
jgi:SAM-dependent methyltransferase